MRAFKLTFLIAAVLMTSGCQLVDLFTSLNQASQHRQHENYHRAAHLYESTLENIPDSFVFHWVEYSTRYDYGVMLNEYVCDEDPDCYPVARKQFEWLLEHPQVDEKPLIRYWLARTYHYEATHTEDEETYYESLETAFDLFGQSAEGFEDIGRWQDLTYAYYNMAVMADWYGDLEEAAYWIKESIKVDKEHGFEEDLAQDRAYLHDIKTRMKEQSRVAEEPDHEGKNK